MVRKERVEMVGFVLNGSPASYIRTRIAQDTPTGYSHEDAVRAISLRHAEKHEVRFRYDQV